MIDRPQPTWQEEISYAILGFAAAVIVALITSGEKGVRFGGGLLLLLGGYAVLKGFWNLREDFGLPLARTEIHRELTATATQIRRDIRRLLRLSPKPVVINAAAGGTFSIGGSAGGRVTTGFDKMRSLEDRINTLEERHQQLEAALGQTEDRVVAMIHSVEAGLKAERSDREAARQSVLDRMEAVMTRGLRFQIIGLVWLLSGTVLTTLASELGKWLC